MPNRKCRPVRTETCVSARRRAVACNWIAAGLIAVAVFLPVGCKRQDANKATLHYMSPEPVHYSQQTTGTITRTDTAQERPEESRPAPAGIRVTGSLFPDEKCQVASNVSGIVREVLVDRGSMVRCGDVLARLDARDAQNALAEGIASAEETRVKLGLKPGSQQFSAAEKPEVQHAKAVQELAEKNYRRDADLLARKVISQQDADKSKNEYTLATHLYEQAVTEAERLYQSYLTAQVHLRTLAKAVEDTTITAPFDGLISEKHVAPGERLSNMGVGGVGTGGCVASLVRINPLRLRLTVSEKDLSKIRVGQKISFHVAAFQERTFTATVTRLSPEIDSGTRSFVVDCGAPNEGLELRPGMFAIASIPIKSDGAVSNWAGKKQPPRQRIQTPHAEAATSFALKSAATAEPPSAHAKELAAHPAVSGTFREQ